MKKHHNKKRMLSVSLSLLLMAAASPASAAEGAALISNGVFTVTVDEAEDALARAIEQEGTADMVAATITNTRSNVLYRYDNALQTEVKTLKINDHDGRFSANLYFVSGDEVISAAPVSGRYEEMVMVPTARQRLRNGDIIAANDLEDISYPVSKLRKDTVMDAAELIGKTPERVISDGRPIRMAELQTPSILEKGATVQMRYKTPYMTISTAGEALEDGAEGDTIKVRNVESSKIVEARIQSAEEVIVSNTPIRVE